MEKENYPDPLKIIRQIERQNNRMKSLLSPTLLFQKQVEKLNNFSSGPHRKFQNQVDLIKNLDPLFKYRNAINHASVFEQNIAWQKAIDFQKQLGLSNFTLSALKGFELNNGFVQSLKAIQPNARLSEILSDLSRESVYMGEYEVIEDVDSDEKSNIILPKQVDIKLESINYLPIKLYKKILDDPNLMRSISPRDFENFVADIIDSLGFSDVIVTPRSGDGGRDIIATKTINDIKMLFAFECKQYAPNRKIQLDTMRGLLGTVAHSETKVNMGVLVTTSSFTTGSKSLILSEALLDGKDFDDLVSWIEQIRS